MCINSTDIDLPLGHLSGLMSTAMIREAPASLQPMITASPTAPQPQIATLLLGSTLAVFRAAPYPTGKTWREEGGGERER